MRGNSLVQTAHTAAWCGNISINSLDNILFLTISMTISRWRARCHKCCAYNTTPAHVMSARAAQRSRIRVSFNGWMTIPNSNITLPLYIIDSLTLWISARSVLAWAGGWRNLVSRLVLFTAQLPQQQRICKRAAAALSPALASRKEGISQHPQNVHCI